MASFNLRKKQSIRIAYDLGYDDSVIAKIYSAKTDNEINLILCTARKNGFYKKYPCGRRKR